MSRELASHALVSWCPATFCRHVGIHLYLWCPMDTRRGTGEGGASHGESAASTVLPALAGARETGAGLALDAHLLGKGAHRRLRPMRRARMPTSSEMLDASWVCCGFAAANIRS
jgi:hypothetical protein